jgi:LacI family transcriptional regulator
VIDVDATPLVCEGHDEAWRAAIDRAAELSASGVTAWVCSSNWPGYQLYRGLTQRGLRVPDDVSITGFDDTERVTLGCPPLTSVRLPRDDMVNAAVARLIYLIDHPDSPKRKLLFGCRIVDHGTIAAPRPHPRTRGRNGRKPGSVGQ